MNVQNKTFFGLIILSLIIILIVMLRSKHFFKCIFLSSISGTAALFAVNLLNALTGFEIAVNALTLTFCALCGTPGVILLLVSRVFLS